MGISSFFLPFFSPIALVEGLASPSEKRRSTHASQILWAARDNGLLDSFGEAGVLVFSPRTLPSDFFDRKLPTAIQVEDSLPDSVLDVFFKGLRREDLTGDWHHGFWEEFVQKTLREDLKRGNLHPPGQTGPMLIGYPGLTDLLACLEVIRRLRPEASSKQAADWIQAGTSDSRIRFEGAKPEPDYINEECQVLSLHGSKGMEFRSVWVADPPYAYSVTDRDITQGQPGLHASQVPDSGGPNEVPTSDATRNALEQEKRRLLYVGMSRATDFLIVSAPHHDTPNNEYQTRDNIFHTALCQAFGGVRHMVLTTDDDVSEFICDHLTDHQDLEFDYQVADRRNRDWQPPIRYSIESFTSLHRRQSVDGEPTVPRGFECPRPQSRAAMIGDQFHRIMHLLCLKPDLVKGRLAGKISDGDLIGRVSSQPPKELPELAVLLANYFSDTENKPWEWLENAVSERPFSMVFVPESDAADSEDEQDWEMQEPILIRGFVDLVKSDELGNPVLIVDYKTGQPPDPASKGSRNHVEQLELYATAIRTNHDEAVESARIDLINYHPLVKQVLKRSQQ